MPIAAFCWSAPRPAAADVLAVLAHVTLLQRLRRQRRFGLALIGPRQTAHLGHRLAVRLDPARALVVGDQRVELSLDLRRPGGRFLAQLARDTEDLPGLAVRAGREPRAGRPGDQLLQPTLVDHGGLALKRLERLPVDGIELTVLGRHPIQHGGVRVQMGVGCIVGALVGGARSGLGR
jgi:hypothetical protein